MSVRLPHSEEEHIFEFYDDDYYYNEDDAFLEAIVKKDSSKIQSPYDDAMNTYKLTWAIRTQSEHS